MILMIILAITALFCLLGIVLATAIGGAFLIFTFGDVIVCIVFIILLIRHLWKKKHEN